MSIGLEDAAKALGLLGGGGVLLRFLAHRESVKRARRSEVDVLRAELDKIRSEYRDERDKWRTLSHELSVELDHVREERLALEETRGKERLEYERKVMALEHERDTWKETADDLQLRVSVLEAEVKRLTQKLNSGDRITPLPGEARVIG